MHWEAQRQDSLEYNIFVVVFTILSLSGPTDSTKATKSGDLVIIVVWMESYP